MADDEDTRTEAGDSGETTGAAETVEADTEEATTVTDELSGREQLEAAIEENSEAVAAFVQRLDAVNELLDVLALAESVGANGDELADTMGTLVELQRSGALDELAELTGVLSLFTDAMTDEMVVELAGTGSSLGELADTAAEPDTRDGLVRMLSAVGTAERTEPAATSTLALLKSLRDDEVKQGLAYVIALARAIGASSSDASETD
ncbi:DUF1641 domain-containing protein [Salinirubellus sp. GCM10025818]|uniref:DUF1641 domain-containing protein n=1 Tax=Salinirubellus TaxID=2162630 RepID=UPI0030CF4873